MRRLAVLLLSGGLDSTTVAALARREGYEVSALTVHYGQSHAREVDAARGVARALGLEHRVVDVSFFKDLAWYSALTQPERFALPQAPPLRGTSPRATGSEGAPTDPTLRGTNPRCAGSEAGCSLEGPAPPRAVLGDPGPAVRDDIGREIPLTYVPLRNTMFLALGAALLESAALDAIEVEGVPPQEVEASLFIAANAIDYSGYPDCRPEYYQALTEVLRLGSKLGTQHAAPMTIRTPLIDKSKGDIVRLALEVGAPLELTWSCYESGPQPCGRCDSCVLRAKGFREAGVQDPALGT